MSIEIFGATEGFGSSAWRHTEPWYKRLDAFGIVRRRHCRHVKGRCGVDILFEREVVKFTCEAAERELLSKAGQGIRPPFSPMQMIIRGYLRIERVATKSIVDISFY